MGVRAWQARGRDASRVGTEAGAFLGEGTGIRLSRGDYNEQGGDTISGAGDAGLASPQRGRFAGRDKKDERLENRRQEARGGKKEGRMWVRGRE